MTSRRWMRGRRPSTTATDQEVLVAAAILRGSGDPRAESLLRQFVEGTDLRRRISGGTCDVVVESTTDDLLVDLDYDVESRPIVLNDAKSGRLLTFKVSLARGGFFRGLHGQCDGRWEREWTVDPVQAGRAAVGALSISPPDDSLDEPVKDWLEGVELELVGVVLRPRADERRVGEVEEREGFGLPSEVRSLLALSNGMILPGLSVLGVDDLYVVDLSSDFGPWWLVAYSDGGKQFLAGPSNEMATLPEAEADPEEFVRTGDSFRQWVSKEVKLRCGSTG
ncbi:SMI1/KNR4 family protein [Nocardioides carbamazepini]|uniref:SMI1/KNR4 family protein n=1 Tax=Nocardioides carbamazepini TaxID=2854259 RepID=UPI00214A5455|nr:SMI1/KNR4 family protein [Nocardioides carbamazepini]MCR1786010.1 SMI1/KNR4 family protein [Nocardioides carbamazepini]